MEKAEFEKIMEALNDRLRACSIQLDDICTTNDLSGIPITRAVYLKCFCQAEEEIMTKIVMVDLYHVIGMGQLTPPQMMQFTYAMQKYLQYRPTVKAIAKWEGNLFELPRFPVDTRYQLQGLGHVALYNNFEKKEECVEDTASVEDYKTSKQQTLLPFRIEGSQIRVDMTQFDFFVTLMTNLFKSPISADNFKKKIVNNGEYLGVAWTTYTGSEAIGQIKSAESFAKLSGYYHNKK